MSRRSTLFLLVLVVALVWVSAAQAQTGETEDGWQARYWNNIALNGSPILVRNEATIDHNWGQGSPGSGVDNDRFSARWTRTLNLQPGRYRFTVTVDDGVRLWVDGELLINSWRVQSLRTFDEEIDLVGGDTPIVMEYFENTGLAAVSLSWAPVSVDFEDWYAAYYDNKTLQGSPVLVRNDQQINFNWGESSPAPDVLNPDAFSARWRRFIDVAPGTYRFTLTVDDGARLYVDSELLIDAWQPQPATTYSATIFLDGDRIPVMVEYFENGGLAQISLNWQRAGATPPPAGTPAPGAPGGSQVIVDNGDEEFLRGGEPAADWHTVTSGFDGSLLWTNNSERLPAQYNWAQWRPFLAPGRYDVSVFIPAQSATTRQARYWISHADGFSLRIVNQAANNGQWVALGNFRFGGGEEEYVSLADLTFEPPNSTWVAYDAVRWTPVSGEGGGQPSLSVSPRVISAGTEVVVEGSNFSPGNSVTVYLGRPGAEPFGRYGTGRVGPDGEIQLSFVMPRTWPNGTPVENALGTNNQLAILLSSGENEAITSATFIP